MVRCFSLTVTTLLITLLLLLATGCFSGPYQLEDGGNNPPPGNGGDPPALDASVPALPTGGTAASANLLALNGARTYQAAASATPAGSSLVLDSGDSEFSSWAVYEFAAVSEVLYPARIKCFVRDDSDDYHLMYGHYNPDSWELHGPYSGDAALQLPDFVDVVADGGQVYAVVIAPAGSRVVVENIILELTGLPSDGTEVGNFLPQLPAGDTPAAADALSFVGADSFLQSAFASSLGPNLNLSALGQFASVWAVYEFATINPEFYPDSVTVNVSDVGGEYYLMYGHYNPASWELAGPFSNAQTVFEFFSHLQIRSPGNRVYVAVVVGSGNRLLVNTVELNLGSGPQADSSVDDYIIGLPDGSQLALVDALQFNGSESYADSYSEPLGASLALDATGVQQSAWAVYEFSTAQSPAYAQSVAINVSDDSDFYYILWANYSDDSWEMVVRPGADASDPLRHRISGDFSYDYLAHRAELSSGGRTYVAVLAQAGTRVVVDSVSLVVADTPPVAP